LCIERGSFPFAYLAQRFVNSALTARFVLRREVSGAGNPPMIHGVSLFEGGCFWFSPGIRESQNMESVR
jgi:hypothetical protein